MASGLAQPEMLSVSQLELALMKQRVKSRMLDTPLAPLLVGHLAVKRLLGQGATGTVYEAEDTRTGATVALKLLRTRDPHAVPDFKREFRGLTHIVHENLVQLHELFANGDEWYFTMELVRGVTFAQYVRSAEPLSGWDSSRLRAALAQLLSGVHAIHAAGKLHCDLKPSNVLVTETGRLVVLDFGLSIANALAERGLRPNTKQSHVRGTPSYMAPELHAGQAPSSASDAYAIGVMLFQALTGRLPIADDAAAVAHQPSAEVAPRARSLDARVPEDLDALCAGLLERSANARTSIDHALSMLRVAAAPAISVASKERSTLLVGRERELAELHAACAALDLGNPSAVFVHGRSGIGKSALAQRFAAELPAHVTVLRGRCHERESLPYKAFDGLVEELVPQLLALPRGQLRTIAAAQRAALLRVFPLLRRCSELHVADAEALAATRRDLRQLAFDALKVVLQLVAQRAPLVLIVDDLQWADLDSARLLRELLGAPAAPVLLYLGCYRDETAAQSEFLSELGSVEFAAHWQCTPRDIALGTLEPHAATAMALALLHGLVERPEQAARRIAHEAAGMPLFVSELADYFIDELQGDHTRLSLAELLARRLRRIGVREAQVLALVALAGRPLPQGVLMHALDPDVDAQRALRALAIQGLLRSDALLRLVVYHDQLREQVVAHTGTVQAAALHRRLASAYEAAQAGDPEWLIEHWHAAGEPIQARHYAIAAAERASRQLAFNRAAALYRTALELSDAGAEQTRELQTGLGEALVNAGRSAEAAQAFLAAVDDRYEDAALELRCRAAQQFLRCGRQAEATHLLRQLFAQVGVRYPESTPEIMLRVALSQLRVAVRSRLPRSNDRSRKLQAQLQVLRAVFREHIVTDPLRGLIFQQLFYEAATRVGDPEAVFMGFGWGTYYHSLINSVNNPARAERRLQRLDVLAAELGTPYAQATAAYMRGSDALLRGDLLRSGELNGQAFRMFREQCIGASWEEAMAALSHYAAVENTGPLDVLSRDAQVWLRRASERNDQLIDTLLGAHMASALLMQDRPVEAERFLAERHARLSDNMDLRLLGVILRTVGTRLYVNDGAGAWTIAERYYPAYMRSQYRAAALEIMYRMHRAKAALVASVQQRDSALLALVEGEIAWFARATKPEMRHLVADTLRAALAFQRGDLRRAQQWLHDSVLRARRLQLIVAELCFKLLLGRVTPGAEGARIHAEAHAGLRAQGVVNPDAWTRIYAAGFERWD